MGGAGGGGPHHSARAARHQHPPARSRAPGRDPGADAAAAGWRQPGVLPHQHGGGGGGAGGRAGGGPALLALRLGLPRGRALVGALLFGALAFGASYALAYWALLRATAGLAQVVMALVPLLTFLFALAHGLEPFRWRALLGAVVAAGGIAVIFGDQVGADVPLPSLLAIVAAAACAAEAGVVVKRFPQVHPVAMNAVAMTTGAGLLLGLSLAAGEARALPSGGPTWAALGYLVVVGSVALFALYLYILRDWTASATAYQFLLFPLVTIAVSGWLMGESVGPAVLVGGALVLAGVYVGALAPDRLRPVAATHAPATEQPSLGVGGEDRPLVADPNPAAVRSARQGLDHAGHHARPDASSVSVDRP
ncbi:MAG: DMT family transporter [Chloroflexi bacterium]|nr:DMT family transporter [Chloroflexota bacterium]